jgi:hypothetical protein
VGRRQRGRKSHQLGSSPRQGGRAVALRCRAVAAFRDPGRGRADHPLRYHGAGTTPEWSHANSPQGLVRAPSAVTCGSNLELEHTHKKNAWWCQPASPITNPRVVSPATTCMMCL